MNLILNFVALTFYFIPTIIGWNLWRRGLVLPIPALFLWNLLTAWTVIGWFGCLVYVYVKAARGGGVPVAQSISGSSAHQLQPSWESTHQMHPCSQCSGGRATCPQCYGSGGQMNENSWQNCSACVGSGSVYCNNCRGTGELAY